MNNIIGQFVPDHEPTREEKAFGLDDLIPGFNVPVPGKPGSIGYTPPSVLQSECAGRCSDCLKGEACEEQKSE